MSEVPSIPEFFRHKNVFVTGGSGFIGKVLVEKLLRSCPDIKNVYLLLREKKNVEPQARVKKITDVALFDVIRASNPHQLKKIKAVNGDVGLLGLGLSPEDRQLLTEEINIIFHSAASVRFDDALAKAILLNTRGTREVCNLAIESKNLEVLVHISTTYCNTDHKVIEERLYPPHGDWRSAINIAESMDSEVLNVLTEKYIHPLPNTYTFTKSLGEHVVYDLCNGQIPVVVFRPSIVISSAFDPFPGWIDNFNGPMALLIASGKGLVRTLYCDPDVISDYVPVDLIVRGMIISAWKQATVKEETQRLTPAFYNGSSHDIRPITFGRMVALGKMISDEVPLDDVIWYPGGGPTKCYYYHMIKFFLFQLVPALVLDGILLILGKKTRLLKIQMRIHAANKALECYLLNQWSFLNDNAIGLQNSLLPCDVEDFAYKQEEIEIVEFFKNATIGAKKYLLKEEDDFTKAKRHQNRMWLLDFVCRILLLVFLVWLVFVKVDVVSAVWKKCDDFIVYLGTE